MNEKPNNSNESGRPGYEKVPVPVGSPGEKIAELAREDRREHPVMHRDKLEAAPEFSVQELPSEPAGVHRLPYAPREYHMPMAAAAPPDVNETVTAAAQGAARLLYKLQAAVRDKPAPALAIAAVTGFAIGRLVR